VLRWIYSLLLLAGVCNREDIAYTTQLDSRCREMARTCRSVCRMHSPSLSDGLPVSFLRPSCVALFSGLRTAMLSLAGTIIRQNYLGT
jgi:hypothetical protein